MKKILTYGSFDLLHRGHVNILNKAKALGNYLIVGLSTDEFNILKNKSSFFSYEDRKVILEALSCVDLVIPEVTWEQKVDDIKKYNIDIFVMGNDWKGKFDYLNEYCEVKYFERTNGISTTEIKEQLGGGMLDEKLIKKNN